MQEISGLGLTPDSSAVKPGKQQLVFPNSGFANTKAGQLQMTRYMQVMRGMFEARHVQITCFQ
jgi:hypothetical protein